LPSCCFLHFPTHLIQCFHLLFLLHYEVAFLSTKETFQKSFLK
jgi:hypothetical protein